MTTENLRREARVDVRVPVVIYRGKLALALETSDVSFKGLFVRSDTPPPLRSLVRLRLTLTHGELTVHAMAVHVVSPTPGRPAGDPSEAREPGVGLQFWGLSGPDRSAWDDFVRGLVHARRDAAKRAAQPTSGRSLSGEHPALSEPATPSGVRVVATPSRAATK